MQLNFRIATQDDYGNLYEIQKKYVLRYEDPTIVDMKSILERIEINLKSNIDTYICVLLEDVLVGYYRIVEDYDFFYDLSFLFVEKEYRRNGIGSQIMDYIKEQCEDTIQTNVFMKDTVICFFLEKHQFCIKKIVSKSRIVYEYK